MNEETIIQDSPLAKRDLNLRQGEKKQDAVWKHVVLGGVSGILMGAGAIYALDTSAYPSETKPTEGKESQGEADTLHVAEVNDNLSFGEAFNAARAEVGAGGVFHWRGAIYNTYTSDEWNAMNEEERNEFAELVRPEVRPNEIPTPTDTHPDVVVHDVPRDQPVATPTSDDVSVSNNNDVRVSSNVAPEYIPDDDVRIVGYAKFDGHLTVGYDVDGDGQADVAIIDMDDNSVLTSPDVAVDTEGNIATLGEIYGNQDANMGTSAHMQDEYMENPEVAPDMPDYMADADVSDMTLV